MTATDPVGAGVGRRHFDAMVGIHEAGHVVIGRILGMPVAGSTIDRVGDHIGCTWSDEGGLQPCTDTVESLCTALKPLMSGIGDDRSGIAVDLQRAHYHVLELLAGVEAERLFGGAMLPNTEHDLEEATAIAGLICRSPASVDAYLAFARVEATALLTDHSAVVLAVADALIWHRTLSGEQIDDILRWRREWSLLVEISGQRFG
jgi:cell division protease FtsH